MSIKKLYYYFFYKIYKSIQYVAAPFGDSLISFKAGLVMITLEIWSFFSIINYYTIIIGNKIELSLSKPIIYLPLIIIIGFNYYTLNYLDLCQKYNKEFEQLQQKNNILGNFIVFGIILLIIANFIFSFYCLDQQARKDGIGPYAPEFVAKKKREDSLQKAMQIEKLKKIYSEDKK